MRQSARLRRVAAAMLSLATAACAGSSSGHATAPTPGYDLTDVTLSAAELGQLAAADDRFSGDLVDRVATDASGNVVMSPASIAIALQMAYAGARGATAAEMAKVLHVTGIRPINVAAAASSFLHALAPLATDKTELLTLANQVWVQDGFALTDGFETAMRTGFGAGMRRTDFMSDPDAARHAINAAVADETHDKIQDLLPAGTVDQRIRLVLTNAVYLHAQWLHPFEPDLTMQRSFDLSDNSTVDAKTMEQNGTFDYAHHDGYQAVRLPYAGGRLAMTVLLPDAGSTATSLLQQIADQGLDHLVAGLTPTSLTLDLPVFHYTWDADLKTALQGLGMTTAFTPAADFRGISTAESLMIAFVRHKAFVAVDERGTEAAAATAVGLVPTSARVLAPEPTVMRVDRPFVFAITDTKTGLPLFLGRVSNPTVGG